MTMKGSAAVWPPALREGSRVALVSPSGPVRSPADIVQAEENARSFGWVPVVAENAARKRAYFAGTDEQRVSDLNRALSDDSIDALWCVRGGFGAMRLLKEVDYDAFQRKPKALIGYSDITALHAALSCRCEVVSFHGPTARGMHSPFSRESFRRAVIDQVDSCGRWDSALPLNSGRAAGRLAGGNLALVASLVGTPFQISFRDAILVIEDINEAVYRVDRMMQQLLLSSSLDDCSGIVAGDFTLPADDSDAVDRSVNDVLSEIANRLGIPCLSGIPVGHIDDQWTIPLGAMAELDCDSRTLRVMTPTP